MKNKEKYAKEIIEIACSGCSIAIIKKSGRIVPCNGDICGLCLFRGYDCEENTREWAESEYIEKQVISKRDRTFLDYLEDYKYIARDSGGILYAYTSIPIKRLACVCWETGDDWKSLRRLEIDFPMVKWSDAEPWKIEDLKKLEVVDEYERRDAKDTNVPGKWIPCSERLPKKPEIYGDSDGYIVQTRLVEQPFIGYWDGREWADEEVDVVDEVIAWMPLPDPYREVE